VKSWIERSRFDIEKGSRSRRPRYDGNDGGVGRRRRKRVLERWTRVCSSKTPTLARPNPARIGTKIVGKRRGYDRRAKTYVFFFCFFFFLLCLFFFFVFFFFFFFFFFFQSPLVPTALCSPGRLVRLVNRPRPKDTLRHGCCYGSMTRSCGAGRGRTWRSTCQKKGVADGFDTTRLRIMSSRIHPPQAAAAGGAEFVNERLRRLPAPSARKRGKRRRIMGGAGIIASFSPRGR